MKMETQSRVATSAELYSRAVEHHLAGDLDEALGLYDEVDALRPDYGDPSFDGLIGRTLDRETPWRGQERVSCQYIEGGLHALRDGLEFCCIPAPGGGRPRIANYAGGRVPVDIVLARREALRGKVARGEPSPCTGCTFLKQDRWGEARDRFLRFLIVDNHAACNARCVYCWVPDYYAAKLPMYPYRFDEGFKWLRQEQLVSDRLVLIWSGGEPTLSKDFDGITRSALDLPEGHFVFLTTALLHSDLIEEALRRKRCVVVVSVDAGTSETYARIKYGQEKPWVIKGEDTFDVVWRVLGNYAMTNTDAAGEPQQVCAKYILMDGNATTRDLDSFFELCVQNGLRCVGLALADEFADKPTPEVMIDAGAHFIKRASEHKLVLQYFLRESQLHEMETRFVEFGGPMPEVHSGDQQADIGRVTIRRQNAHASALRDLERVEETLPSNVRAVVLRYKALSSGLLSAREHALARLGHDYADMSQRLAEQLAERSEQLAERLEELAARYDDLARLQDDRQGLLHTINVMRHKLDVMGADIRSLETRVDSAQDAVSALKRSRVLGLTGLLSARPAQQLSAVGAQLGELSEAVQRLEDARANAF